MVIDYECNGYLPDMVTARYVRYCNVHKTFHFCEVGADRRFDIRQGTVDADCIPEEIRSEAISKAGMFPSYVSWPVSNA